MTPFVYQPLDEARSEIRLLRFCRPDADHSHNIPTGPLNDHRDQLISCELEHVSLDNKPKYTALSYEWGDADDTLPILLEGCKVQITKNLHEALGQLVLDLSIDHLWVDAICINQKDNKEKSEQVSMMGSIYKSTALVIIWLGGDENAFGTVLEKLVDIGELTPESIRRHDGAQREFTIQIGTEADLYPSEATYTRACHRFFKDEFEAYLDDNFPASPIMKFLERPYWYRVWVIQEYVLSPMIEIAHGCGRYSAAHIRDALYVVVPYITDQNRLLTLQNEGAFSTPTSLDNFNEFVTRLSFVTEFLWRQNGPSSLLGLLHQMTGTGSVHSMRYLCSNPKDFVYALLGIATDRHELLLKIDYGLSWQETFTTTARALALSGHSVLMFCGLQDLSHALPSWVPNWLVLWDKANWYPVAPYLSANQLALSRPLRGFDASCGLSQMSSRTDRSSPAAILSSEALTLSGVSIGNIAEVLPQSGVLSTSSKLQANYTEAITSIIFSGETLLFKTWFQDVANFTAMYNPKDTGAPFRILSADDAGFLDPLLSNGLLAESEWSWREVLHALFFAISSIDQDPFSSVNLEDVLSREVNRELEKLPLQLDADSKARSQQMLSAETVIRIWFTIAPFLVDKAYKRVVFATTSGYVGYGPESLKAGDLVAVLYGQRTPLILRPTGTGSYTLVGDAYVDGMMHGEVLQMNPAPEIKEFTLV